MNRLKEVKTPNKPEGQYFPTGQGPPQESSSAGSPLEQPPSHTNPAVQSFRISSVVPPLGQNLPGDQTLRQGGGLLGLIFAVNEKDWAAIARGLSDWSEKKTKISLIH